MFNEGQISIRARIFEFVHVLTIEQGGHTNDLRPAQYLLSLNYSQIWIQDLTVREGGNVPVDTSYQLRGIIETILIQSFMQGVNIIKLRDILLR
jgi:hypothetical protein